MDTTPAPKASAKKAGMVKAKEESDDDDDDDDDDDEEQGRTIKLFLYHLIYTFMALYFWSLADLVADPANACF